MNMHDAVGVGDSDWTVFKPTVLIYSSPTSTVYSTNASDIM